MEAKKYKIQSQRDYRWGKKLLGNSSLTCSGYGCLITCIANAIGITPGELIDKLQFTENDYKYGGGLILWNEYNLDVLKKLGLQYIGRYDSWNNDDFKMMKEKLNDSDYVPIMEVKTRTNTVFDRHWVLPIGRSLTFRGIGWAVNDPWSGQREWKTVGKFAPYICETGWLLFKRV